MDLLMLIEDVVNHGGNGGKGGNGGAGGRGVI
jgi:hypothetical protein